MSASAAPPNRSRCRGTPARSAQDPNPAATPLCPCGDPWLHGEAAPLVLGYRSARRSASTSADIGPTLEIVDFHQAMAAFEAWASQVGQIGNGVHHRDDLYATIFTGFVEPRSGVGHEDAFPLPRLSVRCRFNQGTSRGCGATGETRRARSFTIHQRPARARSSPSGFITGWSGSFTA